ncbi:uncharacterized SAM-binding protein YcdF (DUF218 family) [Paenibacillus sp. DS2015]|uniref:YdcF family protein n=1 Tax=Paenibacillus sp. DS2015 TaxID=3373917 RepID=UPI003D1F50E0
MIFSLNKGRHTIKKIFCIILSICLVVLLWLGYVVWQINRTTSSDINPPVDVAIILGAALWGDVPSPGLRERLEEGLRLYHEGKFKNFIVTGGLDRPDMRYTEAQGMTQYLLDHGVPEEAIILENEATDTWENLLFSQQLMDKQGWTSAVIITHTYHGMRSLEIAKYLQYDEPKLGLAESKVLQMSVHKTREALAFTKWKMNELLMIIGFKSDETVNNVP